MRGIKKEVVCVALAAPLLQDGLLLLVIIV